MSASRSWVSCRALTLTAALMMTALCATNSHVLALPPVPVPPENPITPNKAVLGKMLFWDEQLSPSMAMSCGTCHQPGTGGSDPRGQTIAPLAINPGPDTIGGNGDDRRASFGIVRSDAANEYTHDPVFLLKPQVTPRATNSMINAAFAPNLFWDGRAGGMFIDPQTNEVAIVSGGSLESQSVAPIVSQVEMGHEQLNWSEVIARLQRSQPMALATNIPSDVNTALSLRPDYPELFRRAFGDTAITARRVAFALATYERTLISDQSPFDSFQAGTGTLPSDQQQGFNAFFGANCSQCHFANDLTFSNHTFRNVGLRPPAEDPGRQNATGNPDDRGKFKVPTLRNVGLKKTFMHNGQFTTLEQVLLFYATPAQQFADNRDALMSGTGLSAANQTAVVSFIRNALVDPRVRNQTFPFDRPTLFVDRPADQAQFLGGEVAGTGAVAPRLLADGPALIGNLDYRLGIDAPGGLVGAQATLVASTSPPVAGRVSPAMILGTVTLKGSAAVGAVGTVKWPIRAGLRSHGEEVYVQWLIADPLAPAGEARTQAAKIRFFCGSQGCPRACPADFDHSSAINPDDLFAFLDAWFISDISADINVTGAVDADDLFQFLDVWFAGNGTVCS